MLNVLIISYYFPPQNGVSGWRPYSWYKHFPQNNINTTILTRHWLGNETIWTDSIKENTQEISIEENINSRIIRLPFRHSFKHKLAEQPLFKVKIFSKLLHLFYKLTGNFSIEVDACKAFEIYASEYIKKQKIDLLIISAPPHNLIRSGYRLSKKHNLKYIIDFRDLWDNDELKKDYNPGINQKIHNLINKFYIRKWTKNMEFGITVSQPLASKIEEVTSKKVFEITNGFEKDFFANKKVQPSKESFTISIIGSIYIKQDISVIVEGLKKFLLRADMDKVKINFIGIKTIQSVSEQIKEALPEKCIFLSERLPRETAVDYTLQSHVLLYAGWKQYEGIYSGKIFDYLGALRNILIAPGDDNVIDHIVLSTGSGKVVNTTEDFFSCLMNWYKEWEQTGHVSYNGNETLIDNYTREKQAVILAKYIFSIFNPNQ